jgi:hypothetical protein
MATACVQLTHPLAKEEANGCEIRPSAQRSDVLKAFCFFICSQDNGAPNADAEDPPGQGETSSEGNPSLAPGHTGVCQAPGRSMQINADLLTRF